MQNHLIEKWKRAYSSFIKSIRFISKCFSSSLIHCTCVWRMSAASVAYFKVFHAAVESSARTKGATCTVYEALKLAKRNSS